MNTTEPGDERLFAQIVRWRNNVIDYEIVVDDCRCAVSIAAAALGGDDDAHARADAAIDALDRAIRDRDRAAAHLAHLIDLATVTTR